MSQAAPQQPSDSSSKQLKIFLSWSGEPSESVARTLKNWLERVFQSVSAFMSKEDIRKGALGRITLAKELETSDFGILCLTASNLTEPWILFESGALSKKVGEARVCPFLFGVTRDQLSGPLEGYQSTATNDRDDVLRLCKSIAETLEEKGLGSVSDLETSFNEWWWPALSKALGSISGTKPVRKEKTERDLLVELQSDVKQLVAAELARQRAAIEQPFVRLNTASIGGLTLEQPQFLSGSGLYAQPGETITFRLQEPLATKISTLASVGRAAKAENRPAGTEDAQPKKTAEQKKPDSKK